MKKQSLTIKENKKKTKLLTLVFLLVTFGLMSALAASPSAQQKRTYEGYKSLSILSEKRKKECPGLKAGAADEEDPFIEANRVQANKIKALQRELVAANQKLHDVKAHLFTKGDPTDRARLAELCKELVEKEKTIQEINEKLTKLTQEKEKYTQKMRRMEQTIDALATMTDTQRETKEQAILNFQEQLNKLQARSKEEKEELEKMLANLKSFQEELTASLAEKKVQIKNLENEIALQYQEIKEKDKEIKNQAALYCKSENYLLKQLQDLAISMELENLQNQHLRSEIEVGGAKQKAQDQYTESLAEQNEQLKRQITLQKDTLKNQQIALVQEYLDLCGLFTVTVNTFDHHLKKQKKLASLIREEKVRADVMEKELQQALSAIDKEQQRGFCLESELHKTAKQVIALKDELSVQEGLLKNAKQEFETLNYGQTSLASQLQEKIKQLSNSYEEEQKKLSDKAQLVRNLVIQLELEKTKNQEITNRLQETLDAKARTTQDLCEMDKSLEGHIEELSALKNRILEKDYKIDTLKGQLTALTTNLQQEKLRSNELHKALVATLEESEENQYKIKEFKQEINEGSKAYTLIQEQMDKKKQELDEMHCRLQEITTLLDREKEKAAELESALAITRAEKDSEINRVASLEDALSESNQNLKALQAESKKQQQENNFLTDHANRTAKELELEKNHAKELQNELDCALSNYENEYTHAMNLEETLKSCNNQMQTLQQEMEIIAKKFEDETVRSSVLETNLLKVMGKLDEKETELANILSDNRITSEEFDTLREIRKLRKEKEQLEKLYTQQMDINKNYSEAELKIQNHENTIQALTAEKEQLEKQNVQKVRLLFQQQDLINQLSKDATQQQEALKEIQKTQKLVNTLRSQVME